MNTSELLFWTGIIIMSAAAAGAAAGAAVFLLTGRKLRRKLEQEYGRIRRG